jgi:hypothetical protein
MEQYIDFAVRFYNDFISWSPPKLTLYTMVAFGVLSSWIMTRIVAAPPLFAGPICFVVLTSAAMLSNFTLHGIPMMGITDVQKALLFTLIGHAVAGVLLLAIFRVTEKGVRK